MFCLPPGRPYRTVFAFPPQVPGPRTHWLSHVLLCSPAWRSIVSLLDIFEIDNNTFATVLELVQVTANCICVAVGWCSHLSNQCRRCRQGLDKLRISRK